MIVTGAVMFDKIYSYQNLDINANDLSLPLIIWGICVGIALGVVYALVCRTASGRLVRALVRSGASDDASAKTLAELGLSKNLLARSLLKEGSSMRRSVMMTEGSFKEEKASKWKIFWYKTFLRDEIPQKIDFSRAKFYLPEENRIQAEVRYPAEKHPVFSGVLAVILLIGTGVFATFALPELLQMLDNFLSTL